MCLGSDAYRRVYHGEISPLAKCLKIDLKCAYLHSLSPTNPPASSIFSFIPLGLSLLYLYVSLPLLFSLSFYLLSLFLSRSHCRLYFLHILSFVSYQCSHLFTPTTFAFPCSTLYLPPLPSPLSLSLPLHVY